MFNKLPLILNIYLLVAYALPTDPPANLSGSWPEVIKQARQAIPVLKIDYSKYPQSAENICEYSPFIGCLVFSKLVFVYASVGYSWHCMLYYDISRQ